MKGEINEGEKQSRLARGNVREGESGKGGSGGNRARVGRVGIWGTTGIAGEFEGDGVKRNKCCVFGFPTLRSSPMCLQHPFLL